MAGAQVQKVSLQASGLTCSMCSKAVLTALQEVPFVEAVKVNIKKQEYDISFKSDQKVDFDALTKAVEDAGFSVAAFVVTASVNETIEKDAHIRIGSQYFHFLNASGQNLNGSTVFTIVDKAYTTAKKYKQYSALSKMECVQTGRMAKCCTTDGLEQTRIYHAII
jgi:copper chaperone CopZ